MDHYGTLIRFSNNFQDFPENVAGRVIAQLFYLLMNVLSNSNIREFYLHIVIDTLKKSSFYESSFFFF